MKVESNPKSPYTAAPVEPHRDMIEAAYPLLSDVPANVARDLCRRIYRAMLEAAPPHNGGGVRKAAHECHIALAEFIDRHGYTPTGRELAKVMGKKTHTSVCVLFRQLERAGILSRGRHRCFVMVRRPEGM